MFVENDAIKSIRAVMLADTGAGGVYTMVGSQIIQYHGDELPSELKDADGNDIEAPYIAFDFATGEEEGGMSAYAFYCDVTYVVNDDIALPKDTARTGIDRVAHLFEKKTDNQTNGANRITNAGYSIKCVDCICDGIGSVDHNPSAQRYSVTASFSGLILGGV